MTEEIAARPRIQRLFRVLTAMWALLYLGKATFTLWLLLSASLSDFVLIKGVTVTVVNFSAAGLTILIASTVGRREGLVAVRVAVGPVAVPVTVPVSSLGPLRVKWSAARVAGSRDGPDGPPRPTDLRAQKPMGRPA